MKKGVIAQFVTTLGGSFPFVHAIFEAWERPCNVKCSFQIEGVEQRDSVVEVHVEAHEHGRGAERAVPAGVAGGLQLAGEVPMKRGLLLFAHGARDPNWALPFEAVVERIRGAAPEVAVALAYLDFMTPGIVDAGDSLAAAGCTRVEVVPLFLGAGGHVRKDLPLLVEVSGVLKARENEYDIQATGAWIKGVTGAMGAGAQGGVNTSLLAK